MSDFDHLLRRLNETYAELARLEVRARDSEPSMFLVTQINSIRRVAEQLEQEWRIAASSRSVEVYRYRLTGAPAGSYSVSSICQSVEKFQALFSQVFDALSNGPKERARIGFDIEKESDLKLAYTFPGSFGFVLSVEGERSLFFDKFSTTAEAVFDILGTVDEFHVRDLSTSLGQAVVKRIYDWSKANADADYGVDLVWQGTFDNELRRQVEPSYFRNIVQIIEGTVDKQETNLVSRGMLVGIDTKTKRFRILAQPSGEDYSGYVSDEFDLSKDWTVNRQYDARIRVISERHYATLETKVSYYLVGLDDVG